MSAASIYEGQTTLVPVVNAASNILRERFDVTVEGQTIFNLTQFNYTINTNTLFVYINGVLQFAVLDYTEIDSDTFTLNVGLNIGDAVTALAFGINGTANANLNAYALLADLANKIDQTKGSALIGSTINSTVAGYINSQEVPSIAALRLLDKTKIDRSTIRGYYALGDGGEGTFKYDATDTTTSDNGGNVIVGADGGRWKKPVISAVPSTQFGIGASKTASYNRGAIQAAIDSGYGSLLMDSTRAGGVILVDGQLNVPAQFEIVGGNRWATTIRSTLLNAPIFAFTSTANNASLRNLNLSYQGTPVAGADAIQLNGCQTFDAHRLWISSCWNGIAVFGGGNHEVMGMRCYRPISDLMQATA
jgi:hypothetical protein